MPRQLRTNRLSRELIPNKQTPLSRRQRQRKRPRNSPSQNQQPRQRQPQKQRLMPIKLTLNDQPPRQPRHQRRKRRQLQKLRRLIQRRLAQQRLIPIIKTSQLRAHNHNRQPRQPRPRQSHNPMRKHHHQHKRTNNRDHISDHQQPPKQRIPTHTSRRTTHLRNPQRQHPSARTQPPKTTRTSQRRTPSHPLLPTTTSLDTHSPNRLLARNTGPHPDPNHPNTCRDSVTSPNKQSRIINTQQPQSKPPTAREEPNPCGRSRSGESAADRHSLDFVRPNFRRRGLVRHGSVTRKAHRPPHPWGGRCLLFLANYSPKATASAVATCD